MESGTSIICPPSWTETLSLDALFGVSARLEVDIGCGKGRFLIARAGRDPKTLFLGIDRQLKRLRKADRKVRREQIENVRLLRIEAAYAVRHLLPPESVSVFYIFFPDPWPKRRHRARRLFKPDFLDALARCMVGDAVLHVATDHAEYADQIDSLFREDERFAANAPFLPTEDEQTEFQQLFERQSAPIRRMAFRRVRA